MSVEEMLLTEEEFLAEMVLLFRNEPRFVHLINRYFSGNKKEWKVGDRGDRIIQTLQAGYFKVKA